MISSIFGKTKPVNFIILLGFILFFYPVVHFYLLDHPFEELNLTKEILVLALLIFSVFVIDFIIKRNKLTGINSFAILFFTILFIVFPESIADSNAIFSNFFLLLATRRILSIKSLKNIKLKIFDASLWVLVASLFYEWAILYIIIVMSAIYIYDPKNIRNWFVILSGATCFFVILIAFLLLIDQIDFINRHYDFYVDLKSILQFQLSTSIKLTLYILLSILLSFWAFIKLGKSGGGRIIMIRLVVLSFVLGLLIYILTLSQNSNALMITFFPFVILIANYLESLRKEKVREILLILGIFLPLLGFIGRLLVA